jgi:hypothetical protein
MNVLPVHEIEGAICLPSVVERLARHLARGPIDSTAVIVSAIDQGAILRVAHERWKLLMLDQLQDRVCARPQPDFSEEALRRHAGTVTTPVEGAQSAEELWAHELETVKAVAASGEVGQLLGTFPCKPIAGAIARELGSSVEGLFAILAQALTALPDDPLHDLGQDLEGALSSLDLPSRYVAVKANG